jgi:phosphate transport system substrate-binding protein
MLVLAACSGRYSQEAQEEGASGETAEPQATTLTVKGSDTMVILAQRWAEVFMQENEGTTVQVSGGGSGTGMAALVNGTTDLANSSRPIKDTERAQIRERHGADPVEHRVALDALAVYVHRDNPIQALTIPQLKTIFRGQVTNWNELGGPDAPIVLYSRENNSGTYAYFKEHVLDDEDFALSTQTLPGTAAVINAVAQDANGIGYGGIAYAEGVRALRVAAEGAEPVEPTMENATNGRYPISRHLFVYSIGAPEGISRRYIDFILSTEGQRVVEGVGYYPLPREGATTTAEAAPAGATGG